MFSTITPSTTTILDKDTSSPTNSCHSTAASSSYCCSTPTSSDSLEYYYNDNDVRRQEKVEQCMVILDWDDTIVPTKVLIDQGGKLTLSNVYTSVVEAFLTLLLQLTKGNVCVLSSSTEGWVRESCALYLPRVLPLLDEVQVVHVPKRHLARGLKQKEASAVRIVSQWYSQLPRSEGSSQVLFIGNQPGDISPSGIIRSLLPRTSVKTCLLKTSPSVQDIQRQLTYLYYSLGSILSEESLAFSVAEASSEIMLDLYATDLDRRFYTTER
ncbi:hypothetical protein FOZ60_001833 [Perkinsus olseni]|uniref:Uncharacterized protein n=1 Tax=Perkinsus olseni TaxID=32597 RepID=A0A7J6PIZ4_PEROL|nr:hypothetical protein FOZ60_001833 [Perkinsus olseni]